MKVTTHADVDNPVMAGRPSDDRDTGLAVMLDQPLKSGPEHAFAGIVIGELVGLKNDRGTALVVFPGQIGSAAVCGRTLVELDGSHVGREVALLFDGSDPRKPIVIGLFRNTQHPRVEELLSTVEIAADGERVIVSAQHELVLRCGNASIRLTKSGKVLIQGEYVSTRSSGVNRIKGGSVQIN